MKIKMLGAALTGALMLGATLAGAASAASVPPKSFFIDPVTGEPDVVIVVGATANASDVVSGSLIAAAVGNMATVEETKTVTKSASTTFDLMMDYNYSYKTNVETYVGNAGCVGVEAAMAKWYTDYELFSTQFWETAVDGGIKIEPVTGYDISVALAMPKEVRNPAGDTVARDLTTLWFSNTPKDWDSNNRIYNLKASSGAGELKYSLVTVDTTTVSPTQPILRTLKPYAQYAGGSYDNGNGSFDFNYVDESYAFYTTKAWVDLGSNGIWDPKDAISDELPDECDYAFGGTGTEMEAHEEIQVILDDTETTPDGLADLKGDKGSVSGIVYRTTEIRYPLLENGQNICGISHCDGMVDFETAVKGRLNEIKFLGKMYNPMFSGATYTADGGYLGAYFAYGKPYAQKEKILKVGDSYSFHGWTINLSDINIYENKAFITVEGPELTSPFSFIMVMDSIGACAECCPTCAAYGGGGAFTSNPTHRNEYDPYKVKVTKTKEIDGRAYNFFNYVPFMLDGIKTFVGADGTYLAEFNLYAVEDFGWFEDKGCCDPFVTTPNDYGLAITGGWRKVTYSTQMGWTSWEDIADGNASYILWQPAPACETPCPDANFDTLELQLCDNIDIPDCETAFTVNGPENYFSITISDVDFGKANSSSTDTDGAKIMISQTTIDTAQSITYTKNVNIDPIELIKLDIEMNTAANNKNLVLVGGPVYNAIVKDLVNMGASTVDWTTSPGEWEWIADPFGRGYDALIVAGANREETRLAAQQLVSEML